MTPSLVGRSAEITRLHEALAGAAAGTPVLAFIEGEPGIGKSALLEDVAARARELSFRVFAGRAAELEQDRPFRSIVQALGCTRQEGDARRTEIARLLDAGSGEGLFFRLGDAIEDLVEAEALKGPVLLVIDDLHWADPGTVRALEGIVRRMATLPLAIVAALRRVPRGEELTAFVRATTPRAMWVALEPLDKVAVLAMVRERVGADPGPRLRAHIDGAAGNPFYVSELLDTLAAGSAIRIDGTVAETDESALPLSLVLTILRGLSALPEDVLDILRSGAVLGASFKIADLATAADVAEGEAIAAVKLLRSEGVLADDGDRIGFRHDLIREALYSDLGRPVTASMHRRIGYALAEAGAAPLEVATHLVRGARPGDAAAADWMIKASNDPALDIRSSMALIESALATNPAHPDRSALIVRLAWHLFWMAKPANAIPRLQRLVAEVAERESRLDVMQALMVASYAAGQGREMRSWATQVLELVPQLDDPNGFDALTASGWAMQALGDLEGALDRAERAAVVARDPVEVANAEYRAAWLLSLLCRPEESLTRSERALSLPVDLLGKSGFWTENARALGDLDRIDEAETALAVARSIAEEIGLPLIAAKSIMELAHLRYLLGRWDEALIDAETAASISDEHEFAYTGPDPGCIMSWIAYHRHDDAELDRIRSTSPSKEAGNPPLRPTLEAVAAFDRGEIDTAAERARVLLHRIATAPTERHVFDVLPALSRIVLAADDAVSAGLGRDTAIRLADRTSAPSVALAAARCRVIVDRDVSAATGLVEFARSSPRKLLAAGALEDAAAVLDRPDAVAALKKALRFYEQMGAVRDAGRVVARLRALDERIGMPRRRARPTSGWEALTPAELDVVRLAVQGLTNREIGARLFVSHRTVATHLSHVFDKLGLRSRVDLAREAERHLGGAGT